MKKVSEKIKYLKDMLTDIVKDINSEKKSAQKKEAPKKKENKKKNENLK